MVCLVHLYALEGAVCNQEFNSLPESRKQGIALSEIKYVFLTHAHDGHAGFLNELLLKSPGIKVGNIIFCGDAAMNGVPSLRRTTIWIEDKSAFENSWKPLIDEKADWIYPAHGKPFRQDDLKMITVRKTSVFPAAEKNI